MNAQHQSALSDTQPIPSTFRLVTRSDFDGLVCAVLLKQLNLIDDILFVHPKDMQDGKIEISERDITTNLPYVAGCHLSFDHHASELKRREMEAIDADVKDGGSTSVKAKRRSDDRPGEGGGDTQNHIINVHAPSAARVVYDYYRRQYQEKYGIENCFSNISGAMMAAVDKADSAQFSREEILNPNDWVLLNFLMDSRTGLGRFREFRISNYQLMMQLIDYCRDHDIDDILALPDVKERVELYQQHREAFEQQLKRCSQVHNNLVVLDLRHEETIFAGNRFMIYALYPEQNISIHVLWGLKQQNTVFAIGGSIINRSHNTHIGELCLEHDGGGHKNAGTCQIDNDKQQAVLAQLIERINVEG